MAAIIDSHTHLGLKQFVVRPISEEKMRRPAFRDPMENSLDHLLQRMNSNGIQQAVAFPYPLEEVDPDLANRYVLEAARTFPDRIIPFALIGDNADRWLAQGARGFKQHDILQAPERFDLHKAYRRVAAARVPLILHAIAKTPDQVTRRVKAILASAPDLTVIVAHMGRHTPNTGEHVESSLQGLGEYPNVFFETSTVRDPACIRRAVEVVGAARVLFGSDTPFNSYLDANPLDRELTVIRDSGLALTVQEQILGQNLLRLLS